MEKLRFLFQSPHTGPQCVFRPFRHSHVQRLGSVGMPHPAPESEQIPLFDFLKYTVTIRTCVYRWHTHVFLYRRIFNIGMLRLRRKCSAGRSPG
jgi:hypothetical protein